MTRKRQLPTLNSMIDWDRLLDEASPRFIDEFVANKEEAMKMTPVKPKSDLKVGWSRLAGLLVNEIKQNGFQMVIVIGKQGNGKSIYTFKVAYDVLHRLGINVTPEEVFDNYTFFHLRTLLERIEEKEEPILVWDDAGVEGSSYLHFISPKSANVISNIMKVIRERVHAFLLSTPNIKDLLSALRRYDPIIVKIEKVDNIYSVAYGWRMVHDASGKEVLVKKFVELFKRRYPSYEKYREKRRRYTTYAIKMWKRLLAEAELSQRVRILKMKKYLEKHGETLPDEYLKALEEEVDADHVVEEEFI